MSPLVSVIIPTANRPHYLPRAVESALAGMQPGEVEVIVVPNGPDQSWRESLRDFSENPQIRIEPIEKAHACAARNHGLTLAKGRFVRFLDDDDYLYPELAVVQYQVMETSGADVCAGGIDIIDSTGYAIKFWGQPDTDDFVIATLSPTRMTAVHAHIFQRQSIQNHYWDENLAVRQDTDWMMRLCAHKGLLWVRMEGAVGAYVQHQMSRVSKGTDPGSKALRHTAEGILQVVHQLEIRGELTHDRRIAASDGLWSALQKGLMYQPAYWIGIAHKARQLADDRRPPSRIYHSMFTKWVDPLWLTLVLAPARLLYVLSRKIGLRIHDAIKKK